MRDSVATEQIGDQAVVNQRGVEGSDLGIRYGA